MSDRRVYAIGDVHGCDVALERLLEAIRPTSADQIILLGDLIDRGPDSRRVIQMLTDLQQTTEVVVIMGNHEEMLFAALDDRSAAASWLGWGGAEMLNSYGGSLQDIPHEHWMFLDAAVPYFETDTHILVHANLEPGVPLAEQSIEWLRWQKLTGWERPHPSGKTVVCGHTPMPAGIPVPERGGFASTPPPIKACI